MACGTPLNNQTIALVVDSSVNCSVDFHLQCLVTQELQNLNIFNLRYYDDIKRADLGRKRENFAVVVEFPNSNYFDCENSYEVLIPFEMEIPNLIVRQNAENKVLMDIMSLIMMGIYKNITTHVFERCNLIGFDSLMKVMNSDDSEIMLDFKRNQLQTVIIM